LDWSPAIARPATETGDGRLVSADW